MKGATLSVRMISEAAIMIALSTVLSYLKIFHMPQGGSITAGSMVPLLWISLRRGWRVGLATCLVYGLLQFVLEPFAVHPVQVLLDYPLAFGALGLAGLFRRKPILGVAIGIGGRFIMHFLSGMVFFGIYAPPGVHPAVYSAIYNGGYLGGEFVVSALLTYMIVKRGLINIFLEQTEEDH